MGAYSTIELTRESATAMILELIDDATDEEVADALFALTQNRRLDNYRISPSSKTSD